MPSRVGSRFQAEKRTWQSPEEEKHAAPGTERGAWGWGARAQDKTRVWPRRAEGLHLVLGLPSWLELLPPAKTCGGLWAVCGQRLQQERGREREGAGLHRPSPHGQVPAA